MIGLWKRHPLLSTTVALLALGAGCCAVLMMPTTTTQVINYEVTAHRIPLYLKAVRFLERHFDYALLAADICEHKPSDADCVVALFNWTHERIRPTPPQLPIVDDHPLHIVIRGYGESDQIADVFTTLAVYAGMPAFFKYMSESGGARSVVISFARVSGRWIPMDVERHVVFRDRGQLVGVDELAKVPSLADQGTEGLLPDGLHYSTFLSKAALVPFVVPSPLRAELQQPTRRFRYEVRRLVGLDQ